MRLSRAMYLVVALMILGLASFTTAQMMGGKHGHAAMGQTDSLSQSATMGKGMMGRTAVPDSLMTNMTRKCQTVSSDFDQLQSHFDMMMQMQDMKGLKDEMQKHQEMMKKLGVDINQQQGTWQRMMAGAQSGGTPPMMGQHQPAPKPTESSAKSH
jgi:TolA-binding protein